MKHGTEFKLLRGECNKEKWRNKPLHMCIHTQRIQVYLGEGGGQREIGTRSGVEHTLTVSQGKGDKRGRTRDN